MSALPAEALQARALVEQPPLRLLPAPPCEPPYDDEPPGPALRLVASAPLPPAVFDEDAWLAGERTPTRSLPASHLFARQVLQAILEVLAGVRGVKQLRRDTTPELYTTLADTLALRPRVTGMRPGIRVVRSLHVQERPEGIVEACATIHRGDRVVALALRLEGFEGRWRCTELVGI